MTPVIGRVLTCFFSKPAGFDGEKHVKTMGDYRIHPLTSINCFNDLEMKHFFGSEN